MKKKLGTLIAAVTLVAVMLVGLCACSSAWGSIKSAYEKAGYTETEATDLQEQLVETLFGEDAEQALTVHVMKKGALEYAVIVEFKSTKKMEEMLKDHVTDQDAKNIYEELQKLDVVNGNCFYCGISGADIFAGTK